MDTEGNIGVKEVVSQLFRVRFVLEQKEESILLHIKNLFGVGNVQKTGDIEVFRFNIGSFKSNSVTVDYFLAYPLKGKKNNLLSLSENPFAICYSPAGNPVRDSLKGIPSGD